jgi:hypothetical protein
MNEFELIYWHYLMNIYLTHYPDGDKFSLESVRLFFFESAMFVKNYLY